MRRDDVVSRLKLVGLGLGGDAEDDHGRFLFHDGKVSAENGIFGLWTNLDIGLNAALPGDRLLNIISKCGEELEFALQGDAVQITSGRTKITMRKRGESEPVTDLDGVAVDWLQAWTAALDQASWSMSDDPQRPDLAGVTMHAEDGAMVFYSTTGSGMTRCRVACEMDGELIGSAVIVPMRYMTIMQRVLSSMPCKAIQFSDDVMHTVYGDEADVHLVGHFVTSAQPDRYHEVISQSSEGLEWSPMPEGFADALARVEAAAGIDAITSIVVADGKLKLETSDEFGTINEELDYAGPAVECRAKLAWLRRQAAIADEVAFSERCLGVRKGEEYLYLQSTAD